MLTRFALVLIVGLTLVSDIHSQAPVKPLTDSLGDPLPDGAIARLGTLRFKHTPQADTTIGEAVFSSDGKMIVSRHGTEGSIRLWEVATGKELPGPWSTEDKRYSGMAFSPDSAVLVAAISPGTAPAKGLPLIVEIVLWDIARAKVLQKLVGHPNFVRTLAFADAATLISAGNGNVCWWDVASGKQQRLWKPFNDEVRVGDKDRKEFKFFVNPCLSPDGKHLAVEVSWRESEHGPSLKSTAKVEKEVFGFDVTTGKMLWHAFGKSDGRPPRFAYSRDGKRIALALGPERVEVRDTRTGKLIAMPVDGAFLQISWVGGFALSSDGHTLAAAGKGSHISLWKPDDPATVERAVGRMAQYWGTSTECLGFSPNDKTLLLCADADLQIFDLATREEVVPWDGHRGWIDFVAFSGDGKRLLTGSAGINPYPQELVSWEVGTWKRLQLSSSRKPIWPNLGMPNPEQTVYIGKDESRFDLFDMKTGKSLTKLAMPPKQDPKARGFFSPSGAIYVLAGKDENGNAAERLYAVPSGKLLCQLPGFLRLDSMNSGRTMAFSSDDRIIAFVNEEDGLIHITETATGKARHKLGNKNEGPKKEPERSFHLGFSPDGKLLASWNRLNTIRVWDVETGKQRIELLQNGIMPAPPNAAMPRPVGPTCFTWSPDGRLLAVGFTGSVQLWELVTLSIRGELKGHQGTVRAMGFSHDGLRLATGSSDTTVLIWDVSLAHAAPPGKPPERTDLEQCWQTLFDSNASKAYTAMRDLAATPKESIAWIREKLKPVGAIDAKQVQELIGLLESNQFKVRQQAVADLAQLGEQITPFVEKALAANPPLETRLRLQELQTRMTGFVLQGQRLQAYRAVELLERIGSAEAIQTLQSLAEGDPGALITIQAEGALKRLKK